MMANLQSEVRITDNIYMYIIYTPNLGLEIAVPGREREQGRFRRSTKGSQGTQQRRPG